MLRITSVTISGYRTCGRLTINGKSHANGQTLRQRAAAIVGLNPRIADRSPTSALHQFLCHPENLLRQEEVPVGYRGLFIHGVDDAKGQFTVLLRLDDAPSLLLPGTINPKLNHQFINDPALLKHPNEVHNFLKDIPRRRLQFEGPVRRSPHSQNAVINKDDF